MIFAIPQYESAIGIHVSPPSWFHLPPHAIPPGCQSAGLGCPALYIKLTLIICFTYGSVYISVLFSQIIPLFPSPTEFKSLFFTCVSPFWQFVVQLLSQPWQVFCFYFSLNHIFLSFAYFAGIFQESPLNIFGQSPLFQFINFIYLYAFCLLF